MTLGKLIKWIFVLCTNFIAMFLLSKFLSPHAIIGYMLGVLWMCISFFIIGDRIPRDKLQEWKKIKNDET